MKNIPLSNFESLEAISPEKYVLSEADIDNLMPLKSDTPLEAFIDPSQGKLF